MTSIMEGMEELKRLSDEILNDITETATDPTILSNCCDCTFLPESDVCSCCGEHADKWFDRDPSRGEMICCHCGESIVPVYDSGHVGFKEPAFAETTECPFCSEDVSDSIEFETWVKAQSDKY